MQIELITIIRTLYNNLQQDQKTLGKISKKTEREEKAKERKGGGKGGGGVSRLKCGFPISTMKRG